MKPNMIHSADIPRIIRQMPPESYRPIDKEKLVCWTLVAVVTVAFWVGVYYWVMGW